MRFHELIVSTVIRTISPMASPQRSIVEDLVQDIYLKLCAHDFQILRRLRSDHPNGVFGLVRAVAYSTTVDYLRTLRNPVNDLGKAVRLDALQHDLALVESPESQFHRQILFEQIDAMITEASPAATVTRDRSVFWLYYRQGFTAKEIAAFPPVDLSVKGVESLLYRLIVHIRGKLGPEKGLKVAARPSEAEG